MTMGSISIQSNLSLILIVIIIILTAVYFYLDMRKLKLQLSNLEKNNESFIKEFDKINMGLHTIFKNGVTGSSSKDIIEETNGEEIKNTANTDNTDNTDNITVKNNVEIREKSAPKKNISAVDKVDKVEDLDKSTILQSSNMNEGPQPDLNDELFFNLNNTKSNNIFGEIKEDNNINMLMSDDNNEIDMNILDVTNDEFLNDIDNNIDNELPDEINDDDDDIDDVIDDVIDDGDIIDELNISDVDINITDKYSDMSVKELKEKCIELGIKHSGNKQTLSKRIIDKLK